MKNIRRSRKSTAFSCTMKQFMIEQAKPQDAALLLDYTKAIGGETDNLSFGAEDIHIHVEEKAKQLAEQENSCDNVLFLAKADGIIIGYVCLLLDVYIAVFTVLISFIMLAVSGGIWVAAKKMKIKTAVPYIPFLLSAYMLTLFCI